MNRVTEVLNHFTEPELLNWYLKNGPKKCKSISDEALNIGTIVDALIQQDIRDGGYLNPEDNESINNCLIAWELFKKDHPRFNREVKDMQKELVNDELMGHPDFIINRASQWGIVDLKCSSAIRPKYWTQCAAYAMLLGLNLDNTFLGILRLDKKTALYEYKEITDIDYIKYEISIFNAYHMLFKHNENNREMLRSSLEKEVLDVS